MITKGLKKISFFCLLIFFLIQNVFSKSNSFTVSIKLNPEKDFNSQLLFNLKNILSWNIFLQEDSLSLNEYFGHSFSSAYIGQISNKIFDNYFKNFNNVFNLNFIFSVNMEINQFFSNSFSLDFSYGDKFVFSKKPLNNFEIDFDSVVAKNNFLFSVLSNGSLCSLYDWQGKNFETLLDINFNFDLLFNVFSDENLFLEKSNSFTNYTDTAIGLKYKMKFYPNFFNQFIFEFNLSWIILSTVNFDYKDSLGLGTGESVKFNASFYNKDFGFLGFNLFFNGVHSILDLCNYNIFYKSEILYEKKINQIFSLGIKKSLFLRYGFIKDIENQIFDVKNQTSLYLRINFIKFL